MYGLYINGLTAEKRECAETSRTGGGTRVFTFGSRMGVMNNKKKEVVQGCFCILLLVELCVESHDMH